MPPEDATMLFTDIEGSTELLRRVGSERYAAILAEHQRRVRAAIVANGGEEMGTEGDSFFVLFDDPTTGVRAAIEAQLALQREWPDADEGVRVRMGLHTGPIIRSGTNVIGLAIHEAARVGAAAHGGQVLVSEATRRRLDDTRAGPDGVTVADLGLQRMKGLEHAVRLYQVGAAGLPSDFPRVRAQPVEVLGAPAVAGPLLGRDHELEALVAELDEHRLVTLVGPPGIGKTRLAIEAATRRLQHHADGVHFVDLVAIGEDDPESVADRAAAQLGAVPRAGEAAIDAMGRLFADRNALVVLDNCEHLRDVAADVAASLTRGPSVRVLATSRAPLDTPTGRLVDVGPLARPEILFASRVGDALDPDDPDVVAICRRLDGVPLAVELAAAQARWMPTADITRLLDEAGFEALGPAGRSVPARHRTLDDAVGWSVDRLPPAARQMLARLSVFRGAFDLAAATVVTGGSPASLRALVENSLVQMAGGRYRLLETVRASALRLLASSGDEATTLEAFARWFGERVAEPQPTASDLDSGRALARLREDADHHRRAVEWYIAHDPERGLAVAAQLEGLWTGQVLAPRDAATLLEGLLEGATGAPPADRARAWALLADTHRGQSRLHDARRCAERALAEGGPARGDARVGARVLLGQLMAMQGDTDAAERLFADAADDAAVTGDDLERMMALRELSNLAYERGDLARARPLLEEAHQMAQRTMPWLLLMLEGDLARLALAEGELDEARTRLESTLARVQELGVGRAIAGCELGLARVHRRSGAVDEAAALLRDAVRIMLTTDDLGGVAHALVERAVVLVRDEPRLAMVLLGGAAILRERIGLAVPGSEQGLIADARAIAVADLGATAVESATSAGRVAPLADLLRDAGLADTGVR